MASKSLIDKKQNLSRLEIAQALDAIFVDAEFTLAFLMPLKSLSIIKWKKGT